MEIIRIQDTAHPLWNDAWELYQQSFPMAEQRPLEEQIKALMDPAFHFHLLTANEEFIGLLSWWDWQADGQSFRFGEHFAIRPELRGGGHGACALEHLKADPERVVLLEIDPPADEISRRREKFYARNGFVSNPGYDHVHPSFRPTTDPHRLLLMSYPHPLTPQEFEAFRRFNRDTVLKYSQHQAFG